MKDVIMVGARVVTYTAPLVPDSQQRTCRQCGEAVWIAPSGLAMLTENPGMPVECLDCAGPARNDLVKMSAEQVAELRAMGMTETEIVEAVADASRVLKRERLGN